MDVSLVTTGALFRAQTVLIAAYVATALVMMRAHRTEGVALESIHAVGRAAAGHSNQEAGDS